jgi:hypothetical protein
VIELPQTARKATKRKRRARARQWFSFREMGEPNGKTLFLRHVARVLFFLPLLAAGMPGFACAA